MTLQEYINSLLPYAKESQKKTGVPVSITIGQAILESWKGDHPSGLATNANNYFGIKAGSSWEGATYWADTWEHIDGKDVQVKAPFRKYENIAGSVDDHSRVLSKWDVEGKDAFTAIRAITSGTLKYATDPNYANKLTNVIRTNALTTYDTNRTLPPWVDKDGNIIINPTPRPTQPSTGGGSTSSPSSPVELTGGGQVVRVFVLLVLFVMMFVFGLQTIGISPSLPSLPSPPTGGGSEGGGSEAKKSTTVIFRTKKRKSSEGATS